MSIWIPIKKVINNNLQKPLDVLINEKYVSTSDELEAKKTSILTNVQIVDSLLNKKYEISDEILYNEPEFSLNIPKNDRLFLIGSFVPKYEGNLNVKITITKTVARISAIYVLQGLNHVYNDEYITHNMGLFHSLKNIGDTVAPNYYDCISSQTILVDFESTIGTHEFEFKVKNVIPHYPLKICLGTNFNSTIETLTVNEVKLLGKEVIY